MASQLLTLLPRGTAAARTKWWRAVCWGIPWKSSPAFLTQVLLEQQLSTGTPKFPFQPLNNSGSLWTTHLGECSFPHMHELKVRELWTKLDAPTPCGSWAAEICSLGFIQTVLHPFMESQHFITQIFLTKADSNSSLSGRNFLLFTRFIAVLNKHCLILFHPLYLSAVNYTELLLTSCSGRVKMNRLLN